MEERRQRRKGIHCDLFTYKEARHRNGGDVSRFMHRLLTGSGTVEGCEVLVTLSGSCEEPGLGTVCGGEILFFSSDEILV